MKGKFDAYVLWPLAKRVQNWIVDWFTARNFTVGWRKLLDDAQVNVESRGPKNKQIWIFEWLSKTGFTFSFKFFSYLVNLLCWKARTTDEQWSLLSLKSQTFGLGQTNWADKFWVIWGIFGPTISAHFGTVSPLSMFSIIQPLFLQFGPQRTRDLAFVCP